jgi:hypothetical protein
MHVVWSAKEVREGRGWVVWQAYPWLHVEKESLREKREDLKEKIHRNVEVLSAKKGTRAERKQKALTSSGPRSSSS